MRHCGYESIEIEKEIDDLCASPTLQEQNILIHFGLMQFIICPYSIQ